jgi:predicted dehydrogenase
LRAGVVGIGAFGRHHAAKYALMEGIELVGVADPCVQARRTAMAAHGVPVFSDWRELLGAVDVVSVCSPAITHASIVRAFLNAGSHVLVEKPIATRLAEADQLIALAEAAGRVLTVGHQERFVFAHAGLLDYDDAPLAVECWRMGGWTGRGVDVSVVLDLMIHDLDIVQSLVASPVREVRAVGLPVLSNKVDIANVRLEFENGCVANFTASRVSTERVRKLRFFQPHQYLSLDFARQDLLMIDVTAAAGMDPAQLAALAQMASQHPSAGLSLKKISVEQGEPLRLEIASFLETVRTRATPVVSGDDGRAALALALEINRAIAAHAVRTGL